MPVDPAAIERYLNYSPSAPRVKGRSIDALLKMIRNATGVEFRPTKTIPRPYQLEALAFACIAEQSLLFLKVRMGKTLVALEWMTLMRQAGRWKQRGLVIVPRTVVAAVWTGQVAEHSNLTIAYVNEPNLDALDAAMDEETDLVAVSWSALQQMFTLPNDNPRSKKALKPNYDLIQNYAVEFDLACIDETHLCANATTHRFKLAKAMTQYCDLFVGLTGTPMGRDPFALWAQAYLADKGKALGANFHFFQSAFGKPSKNWFAPKHYVMEFDKKKTRYLDAKLSGLAISYGWDGNVDMPPVNQSVVSLRMGTQQQSFYYDLIAKLIKTRHDNTAEIDAIFVKLRQISSGFLPIVDEAGKAQLVHTDNAKLEWMKEFLENVPATSPVILFYMFTESGRLLTNHLASIKLSYRWLYGGTPAGEKSKVLQDFQQKAAQVLVVNAASGDVGIDLSIADYLCFYESPISSTVRIQCEARPMHTRRGTDPVFIDDLVCSPVERRVLELVKEGKSMLSSVIYKEALAGRLL